MSPLRYQVAVLVLMLLSPNLVTTNEYKYRTYDQIMSVFKELNSTCSDYLRIDTAQSRYSLPHPGNCGKSDCETLIVFMTDFNSLTPSRKQFYASGLVHGNEVLGANVLTELAIELCEIYQDKSSLTEIPTWIKTLLKERMLIFTPMTNANGYYHSNRGEKIANNEVDPNRDFPYFSKLETNKDCMVTIAARTVNEIFLEHLIVNSLTFHGGANVIGYPWGNTVHYKKTQNGLESTEMPDFEAGKSISELLKKYAHSLSKNQLRKPIPDYIIGDMTSTVYMVEGGMEDWAYGGSWENEITMKEENFKVITQCNPNTYGSYSANKTIYDYATTNDENIKRMQGNSLRAMIFLIETNDDKRPEESTLGSNENLFSTDSSKEVNIT